jgi:hypothetical protein
VSGNIWLIRKTIDSSASIHSEAVVAPKREGTAREAEGTFRSSTLKCLVDTRRLDPHARFMPDKSRYEA